MKVTPYFLIVSFFSSHTCNQVSPSSFIAASHFSLSFTSSMETLMISRPLLRHLSYNASRLGFSARQGLHQEAQKSIITTLLLREESAMFFPSGVGRSKSGGLFPSEVLNSLSYLFFTPIYDL